MNFESLLQVALGGFLAIAGGLSVQWYIYRQERKNIAHAFAGEIGAILYIMDRRQYIEFMEGLIQKAEQTGSSQQMNIQIRHNYFQVFESNTSKLGLLRGDLAQGVARFYTLCKSITEDVHPDGFRSQSGPESVERLRRLLEIFKESRSLGGQLIPRLQHV